MSSVWKVVISVSLILNVVFLVVIYTAYTKNKNLEQSVSDLVFELSTVEDCEAPLGELDVN